MFDLKVHEFKQKLIEDINNADIPLTVLNYVLKDINSMIEKTLNEQLKAQIKERDNTHE